MLVRKFGALFFRLKMLKLAEGSEINTPFQGSAAEIIKLAMIAFDNRVSESNVLKNDPYSP